MSIKSLLGTCVFRKTRLGRIFCLLARARSPSARYEVNASQAGPRRFQSAEISTCVAGFSTGRGSTRDHMRPQVLYIYMDFDRPVFFAIFKLFSILDVQTSLFLYKIVRERRKRWILRSEMVRNGPKWT